ncbi:CBS domain-containing protein [Sphingomonas sp.]|jgi:CBS domain-containing protein|uniref:CBS domain-containing protein n=1 Tax=Sphingomonas sp. TaxID=28214 RepID=UPI002E2FEC64|nr:CBS domain-containing protein [Sphingomonas sp.]HEX4693059.1 CBS domain-containing protein [Sphingomonas sp.]
MTVATILAGKGDDVVTVTADHSVAEAIKILAERRIGAVPVMQGGEVAGVFSERDVIHCLAAHGADGLTRSVGDAMTAPAITVGRDEAAIGALTLMTRRRVRHLPVVEDGALVGLVSVGDLVKYRIDRIEADAEAMRAYIQSV